MLLITAAVGSAQQQPKKAVKPPVKKQTAAPVTKQVQPGMVVVKDPETGELRAPTAAELSTLTGGRSQSSLAVAQEERRPDGSVMVRLPESTQVFSVAKIGPDGKLVTDCVEGKDAADKALATRPVVKQSPKQEVLDEK
jgi:hypothetical protein